MAHPSAATHLSREYATPEHSKSVMLREETDEALMIMYQQGNTRAFETLLERHRGPVYNFILRNVGAREVAEDLLQDTFLRVIKGMATYQRKAKFTTWMYTIARNLCIDHSRRKKHRKHPSIDHPMTGEEDGGTLLDVIGNDDLPADRQTVSWRLHRIMRRAISRLAEEQREVFLMREFLNMPFKEIAEVVGISQNTAKSRMRYALEKLRLELDEYKDMVDTLL
jgi:RNA polymerase sigma-70 factor (ECF subfamily)